MGETTLNPVVNTLPIVTVIDATGKRHQLNGWAALIVGLVVVYADRINAAATCQMLIEWGSKDLTMRLNETLHRLKVTDS